MGHTPSTAGTFRKKFRKIPERPRKRSQSVSWNSPREYGWDAPNPYNSRHLRLPEHFQNSLLPSTAGDALFFQKWFRRGPLRAGHGIPSSTGGISDFSQPRILNTHRYFASQANIARFCRSLCGIFHAISEQAKGLSLRTRRIGANLAIGAAIYRSPEALWARNPQKVSKGGFPGLPARSVKKVSKKSQMTPKRVKKTTKSVFGDFFDTFLTLRAGRPGKSFLRLFGDFGARGCGDSCVWGLHTQGQSRKIRFSKFPGSGLKKI